MAAPCPRFEAAKRGATTLCSPHTEQLSGFVHFHPSASRKKAPGSPSRLIDERALQPIWSQIAIGLDASSREMHNGPLRNRRMRNLSTLFAVASSPCIRITYLHRRTHTLRYQPPR